MDLRCFFEQFNGKLIELKNEDGFLDKYENSREWTRFIKKEVLTKILGKEGYGYYPEYFDIDHTWWESKKDKRDQTIKKVWLREWEFKIAIEHENDLRDWTYEVEKLDSIICPLRIVIGYMPKGEREKEKAIVEEQRKKMKNLGTVSGEFGVILLNNSLKEDKEDPFNMKCYLLTEQGTKELYTGEWRG